MPELKVVINNPKTGKSYQKVLENNPFINSKIYDKIDGNILALNNYELEIRGGSDKSGHPIRYDMQGTGKKKALLTSGPCIKIKRKGKRVRKTVVANTINEDIVQLNLKIIKEGSLNLDELFPKKEKEVKS